MDKKESAAEITPVYRQSAAYAREHGELDAYRASNKANMRNVFPDDNHGPYYMRTDYDIENDYVCFIYSPNKFTKCVGERGDYRHPEKVNVAKFDKWLGEIRMMDPDMTVEWIPITIVNPSPTKA